MKIDKLKGTIQDCNLNFLLGSGLSCPFLTALGNIESLLTEVDGAALDAASTTIIRASLYKYYFDAVISKNLQILKGDAASALVLDQYKSFLDCMNSILVKRKVTILSKEINLFTTNIDIFLEKALEDLSLEYNDGFNGRFKPRFSLSNFKISRFKKSLHFDKSAELPVFNLLKVHGSLSWEAAGPDSVVFAADLQQIVEIASKRLPADCLVDITLGATLASLVSAVAGKKPDAAIGQFMEAYEKLLIVNPTKDKFRHTLMNTTYYELLRLYSNELEKENTVLFVMGFSFADEHIREITVRAANSNPTLMIHVIAHTSAAKTEIEAKFKDYNIRNNNLEIVAPEQKDDGAGHTVDEFQYDFASINERIFRAVLRSVDTSN